MALLAPSQGTGRLKRATVGLGRRALQDASQSINSSRSTKSRIHQSTPKKVVKFNPMRLGSPEDPQDAYDFDIEVFKFMIQNEGKRIPKGNIFVLQTSSKPHMRAIVIDWLVDVHKKLRLHTDTLFLAVSIFDNYLSKKHIEKSQLQLLGSTSLFCACKIDETNQVSADDFAYYAKDSFTVKELISMEAQVFATLGCNLNFIHSSHFMKRYLRFMNPTSRLTMLAHYLNESTLMNEEFSNVLPSKIAAAVVYIAATVENGRKQWNQKMISNTGYSLDDIRPVIESILKTVSANQISKCQAIKRKYASENLCAVSCIDLSTFVVE